MKNYLILLLPAIIFLSACKGKKEQKEESPISAVSIIKGQLNHLDTSLYQLTRFEIENGITDSAYIKRNELKDYAFPFLSLPDITESKYDNNYTEDRLIDAQQQTLSITSFAKNEDAEIQKQMIIVHLADISDGKVKSIYIERLINSKDSLIEQKLFWEIDKYFSIGTIVTKENQPEQTHFTRVKWQ